MNFLNSFSLRIIVTLALIIAILVSINGFINWSKTLVASSTSSDFLTFYSAARMIYQSQGNDLYNLSAQSAIQHTIVPILDKKIFAPYFYPPFLLLFFLPISGLSLLFAYLAWTIINIIFLGIICAVAFKKRPLVKFFIILIIVFSFPPVIFSLLLGQTAIIITFIFFVTWILQNKKKEFLSGLVLSLLLIKPQFAILPILVFLVQRRYKMWAGMLLGGFSLGLVSVMLIGLQGVMHYFSFLRTLANWNGSVGIDNGGTFTLQSVLMFLFQTKSPGDIQILLLIILIILTLLICFVWRKKYQFNSVQFDLQWILLILSTLLTCFYSHFYDLSLLLVVGIIIIHSFKRASANLRKILCSIFVAGYSILLLIPIVNSYTGERLFYPLEQLLVIAFLLLAFVGIFWYFATLKKSTKKN